MVPREAGEAAGWFDESLFGTEDHDLWIKVLERGYRAVYTARPLCVYSRTEGSISLNVARQAAKTRTYRAALERGRLALNQRGSRAPSCATTAPWSWSPSVLDGDAPAALLEAAAAGVGRGHAAAPLGRMGRRAEKRRRARPAAPFGAGVATRVPTRSIALQLAVASTSSSIAPMSSQRVPGGVVHELPADLREALIANPTALDAWKDITPLARNEFICWVEDAKQETTRERRIRRTQEELEEGQRRPCCWPGCAHRERTGR